MTRSIISAFEAEFRRYRGMCEQAAGHLPWPLWREALDPETNSIAVIMKHVAGNLRSRWTDPFTTDGEKPWRHRDHEFIDDVESQGALLEAWRAGWGELEQFIGGVSDADLGRTLLIRTEPHTLALALARSSTHIAYHAGQIVMAARVLASRAGLPWKTLTIPRGGSAAFNAAKGVAGA